MPTEAQGLPILANLLVLGILLSKIIKSSLSKLLLLIFYPGQAKHTGQGTWWDL